MPTPRGDEGRERPIRRWLGQLWSDLRASTDPGLLGVLRFFGFLYGPIDRSAPIDQAFRKALRHRLPDHVGWRHAFGGITYLLFILLVVTGVLLSLYYRPSAQEAYPSIQHIVSDVRLGWLIRNLHVWSANLIVLAALAHMARVFFAGAYKPPRETNWLIGLLLLFVILTFGATGYLLPWDQWAYWTVTEMLDGLAGLPLVAVLVDVAKGDVIVSGATLSRFFALHVIVLPWVAFALLVFHFMLLRKHGTAPPVDPTEGQRTRDGLPFFPNHLLRSFIVSLLVIGLACTLALLFPRPISEPADPFQLPDRLQSTWIVVDVTRALIRYLGAWGLGLFTLLGIALALIPLFDRAPERRLRRRPVAAALGVVFFTGFLVAWFLGRGIEDVGSGTPVDRGALDAEGRPTEIVPADTAGPGAERSQPADGESPG